MVLCKVDSKTVPQKRHFYQNEPNGKIFCFKADLRKQIGLLPLPHKKTESKTMATHIDLAWAKQFGNLELLARQLVEGFITGLHRSPYHGFSVEFAEHVLYNPGESTRHIDWKVYAKTDRLYTKRYEEETNLRCQILLDVSPSMYLPKPYQEKLTFSLLAAAAIMFMVSKQRDAVGLTTFADEIISQSQTKSISSHIQKLLIQLENLMKNPSQSVRSAVPEVIDQVADSIHRRSLVVIFSDLFTDSDPEKLFSALAHLRHNQHEVLLFHVMDHSQEVDFDFKNKPYLFIDAETNAQIKLRPNEIREAYQQTMHHRNQAIKLCCGQLKIDYVEANTRMSFDQILLTFLNKRAKMV